MIFGAHGVLHYFVVLLHPVVGSIHKVRAEYSYNCQLLAGVRCRPAGVSSVLTEVFLRCRASAIGLDWHRRAVPGVMWRYCNVMIVIHRVVRWHRSTVSRVSDLRSRGRWFDSQLGSRRKNSGQVSHTYVPLSPSSISWYWPKGGDANCWIGNCGPGRK